MGCPSDMPPKILALARECWIRLLVCVVQDSCWGSFRLLAGSRE